MTPLLHKNKFTLLLLRFSYGKNSSTLKDSIDSLALDLKNNKPYPNLRNSENGISNLQTYSSNLSLESPIKTSKRNEFDDVESPKKFSKFHSKNEYDFTSSIKKKCSIATPNELHKLAIINNMKEKINIEFEVPEENSPVKNTIKKYDSFEMKTKNL